MSFTYVPPSSKSSNNSKGFTYEPPQENKSLGLARIPIAAAANVAEGAINTIPNLVQGAGNLIGAVGNKAIQAVSSPEGYSKLKNLQQGSTELINELGEKNPWALRGFVNPRKQITEPGIEKLGYNKEELKPQGTVEKIGYNVAQSIPQIIATGGQSFWKDIASSAGSSIGQEIAQSQGYGPLGQFVLGLAGGVIPTIRSASGKSIAGFKEKHVKPAQKAAYAQAEKEALAKKWPTQAAKTSIDAITSELESKAPLAAAEKQALAQGRSVSEILQSPNIPIKKIWDKKKRMNELARSATDESAKTYYRRYAGALEEQIQEAGIKHPEFGKNYNLGENLTRGIHAKSDFTKLMENNAPLSKIVTNGVTGAALLMLTGKAHLIKSLVGFGGAKVGASIGRAHDLFKNPEALKLARDMAFSAAVNDVNSFAQSLRKLNDLGSQEEMKEGEFTYQS